MECTQLRIPRGNDFTLLVELTRKLSSFSASVAESIAETATEVTLLTSQGRRLSVPKTSAGMEAHDLQWSVANTDDGKAIAITVPCDVQKVDWYGLEIVGEYADGGHWRYKAKAGEAFKIVDATSDQNVPDGQVRVYAIHGTVGIGALASGTSYKSILEDNNIIVEKDGLYQIKDMEIYPISHPDLSTQPSILPERFGNLPIYEVLIAYGREDEIPIDATVIMAFSFNGDKCVPAVVEKKRIATTIKTLRNKLVCEESLPTINPEANLHFIANFELSEELLRDYFRIELEVYGMPTWCHVELDASGIYIIGPSGGSPLGRMYIDNDRMGVRLTANSRAHDFEYNDGIYDEEEGPEVTKWDIANSEGFTPDFTLIRYFGSSNNNYY